MESKNTVAMVTYTTSVRSVYLLHCTSFVVKRVKAQFKCVNINAYAINNAIFG